MEQSNQPTHVSTVESVRDFNVKEALRVAVAVHSKR
jgi:hypothetical protein